LDIRELLGWDGVGSVTPRNHMYKEWVESHPRTVRRAL